MKVIQLLIDTGADVNYTNENGQTAIFYCKRPQYLMQLLSNGADLSIRDKEGKTALWQYATDDMLKEVDEEDALEILRILLEYGLHPNDEDFYGRPLLTELRESKNYRYAAKVRKILLQYGVEPGSEEAYRKQVNAALQRRRDVFTGNVTYESILERNGYDEDAVESDPDYWDYRTK